ncbi:MFS transporter [Nocardioides psychrotolerans]|uniref:Fucose permease n=1 Tax=Nocardioides psychrotolerans TaxID=1005945 RepID=A0A1I3F0K0_9ACTN|nr:MFS transporter [Nocardioides psychrotolerans]GEP37910.1 MFS transporter [Nocardioides psychrotolerans]SFI04809.1 Fucose permease [Nocardioides psychrotolerans]
MTSTLPSSKRSVAAVFALNGVLMASLISRIPSLRERLALDNGALGLLLLAIAAGSVLALPTAGRLIARTSAADVVRLGAFVSATGLITCALGAFVSGSVVVAAVGLFLFGVGSGLWDVAMNVEGAEVERLLGRTIMPRFHAAWSFGNIGGAGIGVAMAATRAPVVAHLAVVSVLALLTVLVVVRDFLPVRPEEHHEEGPPRSAWIEPRTLAIGLMVLTFAVAEGAANDWLSLALIDGYDARHWVGVSGYALFVTAMSVGRLSGPVALDRLGRRVMLWVSAAAVVVGTLLTVLGEWAPLVALGILVWGLGAALGFPVGMSAAADDPRRSAARVSVVSTIGYAAFLTGPPLLGALGDHVGTLDALLVVTVLMAPAAVAVLAAAPAPRRSSVDA